MKIEKDRMLWGESLPFIAEYVADELKIADCHIFVKSVGIKNPIPYEYTFIVDTHAVSMYFKVERSGLALMVKTPESLEFSCDTFGEVVENIRWLVSFEEEEVG